MVDVKLLGKRVVGRRIILTTPGFILFSFDNLDALFVEDIMLLQQPLELLDQIVGDRLNLHRRCLEDLAHTGVDVAVNENALHAGARPPLLAWSKRDRYNLPLLVVRRVSRGSILLQRRHHQVVEQNIEVNLRLVQRLARLLFAVHKVLVEFSILIEIK